MSNRGIDGKIAGSYLEAEDFWLSKGEGLSVDFYETFTSLSGGLSVRPYLMDVVSYLSTLQCATAVASCSSVASHLDSGNRPRLTGLLFAKALHTLRRSHNG